MANNVKKPQNRSSKNTSQRGSASKSRTVASSSSAKSSSEKKKPALESVNINGRRNVNNASGRKTGTGNTVSELEKRGYITRSNPEKVRDRAAEAKRDDIIIIVVTLLCILMVLSYIGICGVVGTGINAFIFGLFGRLGYILPFIILVLTLFIIANKDNGVKPSGIIYAVILSGVLGALIQLAAGGYDENIGLWDYFSNSSLGYEGNQPTYGGLFGGIFVKLLCPLVGKIATVLILIALLLILFVLMTGKPFIMAVIRKVNRRIKEYRRRRAIEKNEQEYYSENEDEGQSYVRSTPNGIRYGLRRLPERRMGTMNVSFTKKDNNLPKENDKRQNEKAKTSIKSGSTENIRENTEQEKKPREKSQTMYIPGVGNVRLGKDAGRSAEIVEEEYTDKDFDETLKRNPGEYEESLSLKRETTRKENPFENSNITSVGIKKLHSGSIDRFSDNSSQKSPAAASNITSIHGRFKDTEKNLEKDTEEEEIYNNLRKSVSSVFDSDDELYGDPQDEYKEDEKEVDESVKDGYAGDSDIARSVQDLLEEPVKENTEKEEVSERRRPEPVKISDKEITDADADEAAKQYDKVTRIGSGAAVFTDMTKEPEKPKMPEYKFPPVSLLSKSKSLPKNNAGKKEELEATINKLQSTFESFGVKVTVTDASVGPTVTRYELLPDQGVKVKTITSLSDDIKLALAAPEIRIEAPIPGKAAVGIEVPNKVSAPVLFGDMIDSDEFRNSKTNLAFAVGKDIGGENVVANIGSMPHALIAGATGSGKSVCINALIMSILYKAKPEDVKMIMIDPKRVELVGYNGIPHLIVPVVTDVKKAAGALAWAVAEMDDRYKRFADAGVRDLAAYNSLMEEKFMEEGKDGQCTDKLPQIIIIVDELNDLMMTANSKDVEADISRLTQLARACGIHVILATQRPSVNVITGTIKANIPTRIAFSVSSIVDSRTILDQAGAEKLLGKGDMLFYPQGYPKPVRLQGAYVSDGEVAKVVKFIKDQYKEMKYNELVSKHIEEKSSDKPQAKDDGQSPDPNANDEFFEDAARLIIKKQKASVGMLQREFRIGFNRAARIMDQLAEDGIVGPEDSTKPRKILMTLEDFEQYLSQK